MGLPQDGALALENDEEAHSISYFGGSPANAAHHAKKLNILPLPLLTFYLEKKKKITWGRIHIINVPTRALSSKNRWLVPNRGPAVFGIVSLELVASIWHSVGSSGASRSFHSFHRSSAKVGFSMRLPTPVPGRVGVPSFGREGGVHPGPLHHLPGQGHGISLLPRRGQQLNPDILLPTSANRLSLKGVNSVIDG